MQSCSNCGYDKLTSFDKACPKCKKPISGSEPPTQVRSKAPEIAPGEWSFSIQKNDELFFYSKEEIKKKLPSEILEGRYEKNSKVVFQQKDKKGNLKTTESTLFQFAKRQFQLSVLYRPVWAHATAGMKWGIIVGIFLKFIDTFILFLSVNITLAVLFAVATAVCIIPKIGWIGIVAYLFFMVTFKVQVNLFFTVLVAGITGAVLGCLPGMAVGGIVGYVRKKSLPSAKDAIPEQPVWLFFKAVLIPLLCGGSLFSFYLFVVNPWLAALLE